MIFLVSYIASGEGKEGDVFIPYLWAALYCLKITMCMYYILF